MLFGSALNDIFLDSFNFKTTKIQAEKSALFKIVASNIHIEWKGYFKLSKDHCSRTAQWTRVILEYIKEKYTNEKLRKNIRTPEGNFSSNSKEGEYKNKCGKPSHDIEW